MFTFPIYRQAWLLTILLMAMPAQAEETPKQLRVCISDIAFQPYTNLEGSGHVQYLLSQTAKSLKVNYEMRIAPHRRCQAEVKNSAVDGTIGVYNQERSEYAAFPMAAGRPDNSKALVTLRVSIYRRIGSPLEWDGQRFSGLGDGIIGIQSGFAYTENLRRLGVRYDDSAKSVEQNIEKLALGRLDGVLMMDLERDQKVLDRFANKIEHLSRSFDDQTVIFLFIDKSYYAKYPDFVESYWKAIKNYRESADYLQYRQQHP